MNVSVLAHFYHLPTLLFINNTENPVAMDAIDYLLRLNKFGAAQMFAKVAQSLVFIVLFKFAGQIIRIDADCASNDASDCNSRRILHN